jgi:hypothetical protein
VKPFLIDSILGYATQQNRHFGVQLFDAFFFLQLMVRYPCFMPEWGDPTSSCMSFHVGAFLLALRMTCKMV